MPLSTTPEANSAIKFLIAAFGILLKAQPAAFWQVDANREALADLVPYTIHPYAGVR